MVGIGGLAPGFDFWKKLKSLVDFLKACKLLRMQRGIHHRSAQFLQSAVGGLRTWNACTALGIACVFCGIEA